MKNQQRHEHGTLKKRSGNGSPKFEVKTPLEGIMMRCERAPQPGQILKMKLFNLLSYKIQKLACYDNTKLRKT